jgi:hypothetical protein
VESFIYDTEVVLVVQEASVRIDLGIDTDPELHIALELLRAWHDGATVGRPYAHHREPDERRAQ